MKILVTGGAGFIGSSLIRFLISETQDEVINVDKLTYAGNLSSLKEVECNERYFFEEGDICDAQFINKILNTHKPDCILHLAAESHVDRSINKPSLFITTNIVGTFTLLQEALNYWHKLNKIKKNEFRFLHISTDEVYGDLSDSKELFTEMTNYDPSSPYSASKASSDHLVRAWHRTYNLPTLITNCSNNYGPFHFPEKLIPLTILNALKGKNLPIYGKGHQIRDWLYVEDHVKALYLVVTKGRAGETYNIGGLNELKNITVVEKICSILDSLIEDKPESIGSFSELITFVEDRPGHDKRYAIDPNKIMKELGWYPKETFESGLNKTISWYLDNQAWLETISTEIKDEMKENLSK